MVTEVEKIKKHTGRGRPVLLNDLLKQSIILYKSTNPGWSAEKILNSIKINYYNKLRKVHPDWPDAKIREQAAFPGVNRVQRYLKEISPLLNQKSPLQEKWHLGTLNDYPITPEAVKKIFELKARGKDYISIRIARWISRLSVLPLPVDVLYLTAMEYSTAEEIAEISRTELNTATMDLILQEHMTDEDVPNNGSDKPAAIPVKNDVPLLKIEKLPVKNDIPVSKPDTSPAKNDIAPVKPGSDFPKPSVTPVQKESRPEKTDIKPQKKEATPEKPVALPEKSDITPYKNIVPPVKAEPKTAKSDAVPLKNETAPDEAVTDSVKKEVTKENDNKLKTRVEKHADDEKSEAEKPASKEKPDDSFRKYHLPDMRERQDSINEFLKFVQKQKDKEL
jgi:hypothetical protein